MKSAFATLAMLMLSGCNRSGEPGLRPGPAVPQAPAAASSVPAVEASAVPSSAAPSARAPDLPDGATACGELGCLQFDTAEAAFGFAIASKPRVLAIGEAHAQKGKEGVASSAKRFTDTLLPLLKGKASDLVLELMMPNDKCKRKTEEVREKQKVVTSQQRESNQNEYVQMGERARALGIVPDLLRPSCEDLAAIDQAGAEMVPTFLSTIARLTAAQVRKLLDRDARTPADADKMVVTYGGILHNDLEPTPDKAAWSFGPALWSKVGGRYVAVDLFVPEYIEDTDTWRQLPWYSHYDRARMGGKTTMFRLRPGSFVIIFPLTASESR